MKGQIHFDIGPFCVNLGGSITVPPTYVGVEDEEEAEVTDISSHHPIGFRVVGSDDDDDNDE